MENNASFFLGCDKSYRDAKTVLFGAPFDGTASFRPGARFAPSAMRTDSWGLETYSPYQDKDLSETFVIDAGDIELPFGNTKKVLASVQKFTGKVLADKKTPCMIGGEHLVTLGAFRAVYDEYPDVCILHFDAHTDLRDQYLGESLSHATVMRRIWDTAGDHRIWQFGIRSGEKAEFEWAKKHTFLTPFGFDGLKDAIHALAGKPVYFSLDLDILDTAVFPGTGTPEPGGVTFKELLGAVLLLKDLNIIALDVCELSPPQDPGGASTAAACKILRELLLLI
jgi:agmatinase